jgi:hypothetical protein
VKAEMGFDALKPNAVLVNGGAGSRQTVPAAFACTHVVASNSAARLDTAACLLDIGKVQVRMGDETHAAEAFHEALAIVEPFLLTSTPEPQALYTAWQGLASFWA